MKVRSLVAVGALVLGLAAANQAEAAVRDRMCASDPPAAHHRARSPPADHILIEYGEARQHRSAPPQEAAYPAPAYDETQASPPLVDYMPAYYDYGYAYVAPALYGPGNRGYRAYGRHFPHAGPGWRGGFQRGGFHAGGGGGRR